MGDAAYNKLYRVKATTVTICVGILNVGAEADQRNCSLKFDKLDKTHEFLLRDGRLSLASCWTVGPSPRAVVHYEQGGDTEAL